MKIFVEGKLCQKKFTKNFFGSEIKNKEYHLIVVGDEKIFLGSKLFIFIKMF